MTVLLHWSDPHFGAADPGACEALRRLAWSQRPAVVLLTGDITQRARRAQFDQAARYCATLPPARWVVVPGNHDLPLLNLWLRCLAPYRRYSSFHPGPLDPVVHLPGLLVLGVHTTRPWRHARGELSAAQIAQVSQHLRRAAPDDWRLVLSHHPVVAPWPHQQGDRVRRHEQARQAWSAAGVDLLLSGHLHQPGCVAWSTGDGRQAWAAMAGTAVSRRLRAGAPHSVHLLRRRDGPAGPALPCLERWELPDGERDFVPVALQTLTPRVGAA